MPIALCFGEKKGTIERDRHQSIQAEVGIFYAEKHTSLNKIGWLVDQKYLVDQG